MSRATTRAAIAAYLAPPNVAGLNKVYTAPPKFADEQQLFAGIAPGTESGAVGAVHIEREFESRTAIGGATSGRKHVVYDIGLVLWFRSYKERAEDGMADYDALIEAIKTRLRADRTLTSSAIFQAGEGPHGIELVSDMPKQIANGGFLLWSVLRFKADEFIAA